MASDEIRRYSASDVPGLRRGLADYYGADSGVRYYYQAMVLGQQPIRPPGPPDVVAQQLAAAEAARLRDGELWYIDEDLCALLAAAYPSMPAFAPRPADLPAKSGFAVFAEPIAIYPAEVGRRDDMMDMFARDGDSRLGEIAEKLYSEVARIVAVSWGPIDNPHWPAGGVWMSFYAEGNLSDDLVDDPEIVRRANAMMPPLNVDNEVVIAWRPDDADPDTYRVAAEEGEVTTVTWARLVFSAFQLAAQANLAESDTERTPRPERRRTQHAGLPERDVRIVRLRRSLAAERDTDPSATGSRDWRHRWVVRGHWRNHWYPKLKDHRPLWIAPYLKGPDGAPLLDGEKVTVATADPPGPATS